MSVSQAQVAYQQEVERYRAAWRTALDDDERDLLLEDLGRARDALERAYLERQAAL